MAWLLPSLLFFLLSAALYRRSGIADTLPYGLALGSGSILSLLVAIGLSGYAVIVMLR
ncbi:hypothetical protein [Stutzerimonas azotifigens]|uniref:hypothetical protein n=1 Tax=Stutzerimonas azotifigens TaxID=291995 RepID=UPI000416A7B4|nr:hypothetical protein [Stutzerimonas azotifigens]